MGLNIPGVETLSVYGGVRVLSRVHAGTSGDQA
jgi:hypothetical protein